MENRETVLLGKTGLEVGRLGVAPAYGAPAAAFEEAFERGCNYFYWGARRTASMGRALRNLKSRRPELVVAVQSFARTGGFLARSLEKALGQGGLEYADVLLLGWHNSRPSRRLLDQARRLKERGLCRFIGLTGHNRKLFAGLAGDSDLEVLHLRYNAAHRGAEKEALPVLQKPGGPGVVAFTATCWARLLDPKNMPPGQPPLTPSQCYRFVLAHPAVHVCMAGPKNIAQMRQALLALDEGPMRGAELTMVRSVGDHVYRSKKRILR